MIREPNKLMIAGDWHGNWTWAVHAINYAHQNGADTILQLGDFGFWVPGGATANYLNKVEKALAEFGIDLYWLDGNHEYHADLKLWHNLSAPVATKKRPHIHYLPRGYQWEWWGKAWMSVGGAVSVDKHLRGPKSWWPEETLTDEQVEHCCRGLVDVIVSHDCPSGVDIPGLSPPGTWPDWVIYESDIHRRKLRRIWDETGATRLFHGHYHSRYDAPLGDGLITGLDCDNTSLALNTDFHPRHPYTKVRN